LTVAHALVGETVTNSPDPVLDAPGRIESFARPGKRRAGVGVCRGFRVIAGHSGSKNGVASLAYDLGDPSGNGITGSGASRPR
jgi:hypothetical protein